MLCCLEIILQQRKRLFRAKDDTHVEWYHPAAPQITALQNSPLQAIVRYEKGLQEKTRAEAAPMNPKKGPVGSPAKTGACRSCREIPSMALVVNTAGTLIKALGSLHRLHKRALGTSKDRKVRVNLCLLLAYCAGAGLGAKMTYPWSCYDTRVPGGVRSEYQVSSVSRVSFCLTN